MMLQFGFSEVLRVQITQGLKRRPVAAFPSVFNQSGNTAFAEMDNILRNDLKISGRVTLYDQSRVDEAARQESLVKTEIVNWQKLGVEFVIKAQVESDLGALKVSYLVFDCNQRKDIARRSVKGTQKGMRELGHKIADEIMVAITGKPGLGSTKFAFVSDMKGQKSIYSCDLEGRDVYQLVMDKSLVLSPCWGPNRESVLYTSYRSINPGLFIKYLSTGRIESVSTFPGLNANGKLNPNNEVVFTASVDGTPEIYRKNLLTGETLRLTKRHALNATPCWSPDGRLIAFSSSFTGQPQIYIMNRDGKNIRQLTDTDYNTSPEFSGDGRYLAYVTQIRSKLCIGLYDFENDVNQILVSDSGNAEGPSWCPDDTYHLSYSSDKGGQKNIYIIDVETKEIFQVTKSFGNCTNPSWK